MINVKGQARGLPESGREYEQGLHRDIGGSGASEVRDHWAGPPTPQGERYLGQASQSMKARIRSEAVGEGQGVGARNRRWAGAKGQRIQ